MDKLTRRPNMKRIAIPVSAVFAVFVVLASCAFAHAEAATQVFPTSAGPVTITPLNHASTLIEAGGKVIYLDPAKPAKFAGRPKADLILITDIHRDHRQTHRQRRNQDLEELDY